MPRFRKELDSIAAYQPGIRPDQLSAVVDEVVKLSSNESPFAPFPEVVAAIARASGTLNRYPDNDATDLREALGGSLGVDPHRVMLGAGSNSLLFYTALAVGGPGTSAVYAHPSFAMYRISTIVSGSDPVEVALDREHRHDLDALLDAIRPDTTIVYVCNPNNPTGTHVGADALASFVEDVRDDILIVVDEAYAEFATAADFSSALDVARDRNNVVVYRTFSKIYGLAGLRLGYCVGPPEIIGYLRRVALPFAANSLALAAGLAALRCRDRLAERVMANADGRAVLHAALDERAIHRAESQANFVYMEAADGLYPSLQQQGVIVRRYGSGFLRVTVGTDSENQAFVDALDGFLAS